jgi:hypothetical protein
MPNPPPAPTPPDPAADERLPDEDIERPGEELPERQRDRSPVSDPDDDALLSGRATGRAQNRSMLPIDAGASPACRVRSS